MQASPLNLHIRQHWATSWQRFWRWLPLLRWHSVGKVAVWIFSVEGTVDLFTAITLATIYRAAPYMGAAYWIPAFWVPALLVTHYVTFVVLLKSRKDFA